MGDAQAAEVLRRARDRISDPTKWLQGSVRDNTNRNRNHCAVCAWGAIVWALGYKLDNERPWFIGDEARVISDVEFWLIEAIGAKANAAGDWNDAATTTHADVLAAFDRAIELAEGPA